MSISYSFFPSHPLQICVLLPLHLCLHFQFFPHLPPYINPSLSIFLSTQFSIHLLSLPLLHVQFSTHLCLKPHCYISILFLLIFLLVIFLSLSAYISNFDSFVLLSSFSPHPSPSPSALSSSSYFFILLCPLSLHIPFLPPLFIPLTITQLTRPHSSRLHITHYHLNPIQIIVMVPLFFVSLL